MLSLYFTGDFTRTHVVHRTTRSKKISNFKTYSPVSVGRILSKSSSGVRANGTLLAPARGQMFHALLQLAVQRGRLFGHQF